MRTQVIKYSSLNRITGMRNKNVQKNFCGIFNKLLWI